MDVIMSCPALSLPRSATRPRPPPHEPRIAQQQITLDLVHHERVDERPRGRATRPVGRRVVRSVAGDVINGHVE